MNLPIKIVFGTLYKSLLFVVLAFVLNINTTSAQGSNCNNASPFCGTTSYQFPGNTGNTAPSGPNYGCMMSQPNPVWYYMQINQPGTIGLTMGGGGLDIDFAMWGPFPDQASGCQQVMNGVAPIQSSYSASSTENIGLGMSGGSNAICSSSGSGATTPPAAQAGQVYIVMISNYTGSPGTLSFNQTSGTGSTNCAIVNQCNIANMTATAVCNGTNTTISGTFNLTTTITTGTLTVTSSCGGSQTFNPPFATGGAAVNYSFNGGAADGAACTVTAVFSADPACTATANFTKPATTQQPTISVTPAGCTGTGGSTVTNYSAASTYTFTPAGPTIGAGGVITGAVPGTTYTVDVTGNGCGTANNTFVINLGQTTLAAPTFSVAPSTCDTSEITTISNYDNTYTYTITPTGPTISTVGVIENAVPGTAYTVSAVLGTCTSPNATFTNAPKLPPVGAPLFINPGPICAGTTLVLPTTSTNNITGVWSPAANDTITTTYTFASDPGQCASDTTITVIVKEAPVIAATPLAQTICSGEKLDIRISSDSTGVVYGWVAVTSDVTGATNKTGSVIGDTLFYSGATSGTVTYAIIGTKNGCSSPPIYVTVNVNPAPTSVSTITLSADPTVVEEGSSSTLGVTITPYIPGVLFNWIPTESLSCTDCPDPIATPLEDTWYTVKVTTPEGCNMKDSIFIKYKIKCGEIYVPNIFSPNQDGSNDGFKVYSRCLQSIQLSVFDRWGNRVFYSDKVGESWDGTFNNKPMNSGTYIYRATVSLIDGTVEDLKGTVTLVR